MDCKDFEKNIVLYTELSNEEKSVLNLHVENCEACSKLFQETVEMQRILNGIASEKINPPHAARLTAGIMAGIQKENSAKWKDQWFQFLQHSVSRIALSAVSTLLLITFSIEFFQDATPVNYSSKITSGLVVLNSQLFKQETARQKSKARLFAECTSPFKPQQYLIDCAKSKFK